MLFIPGAIALIFTKQILILFGQDPNTAEAAQEYMVYFLPAVFALNQFETIRRYLQAMGLFDLTVYFQFATFFFHIGY